MDTLRWRVGDATVIRVPELDATAALEGLIPRLDLAAISEDAWLRPDFVDDAGHPRGLVQAFVILIAGYTIMRNDLDQAWPGRRTRCPQVHVADLAMRRIARAAAQLREGRPDHRRSR